MKVSLFLLDDFFDPHSAKVCVKPEIHMRQMTHENFDLHHTAK